VKPKSKSANALSKYGFKQVTPANLFEEDNHPAHPSSLRGEKWVKECLKPELDPSVPEDVAFLFEMARGSMIYGIYFLPLAALATEEGFRVLEAGVRYRCKQLGIAKKKGKPNSFPSEAYADLVKALHKVGTIPKGDLDTWSAMVGLRNNFSHRTSATIRRRHEAVSQLSYIAELLNRLFK
jgi:hypothetical protein